MRGNKGHFGEVRGIQEGFEGQCRDIRGRKEYSSGSEEHFKGYERHSRIRGIGKGY